MGNRSYLYFDKDENDLFEANNSLPFFWIGLLDKNIIDMHKPAWLRYDELEAQGDEAAIDALFDTVPSPLDFAISRDAFDINALRTQLFLQKHYAHLIPLYEDFKQYVQSKFNAGDHIILNALEMANFYASCNQFIQTLYDEIGAIEQNNPQAIRYLFDDDLIASGTGFSLSEEFSNNSQTYQQAMKTRSAPSSIPVRRNMKYNKRSVLTFWIILALCPVFSYITYRGYTKEGFSGMVILLALCNVGFYWFSISQLMVQAKANKKEKAIA